MSFKSLINIRSICPLAETEKPVNANEWESKAIRVHYGVPLVSTAVSLGLSTAGHADPNWKMFHALYNRWDTCAFYVLGE